VRAVTIIPRPPNADSCVPQLYLLASASVKLIAVNYICRIGQVRLTVLAKHYGAIKIAQRIRAGYAPFV
jgi:hypothetical protein